MYKKISMKLANCLIANDLVKSEYKDIYAYGFENIISTVFNCVVVLFAGYITNLTIEFMIYMLFYGMLRSYSGGFHQRTHLRCVNSYILFAMSHIMIMKYVMRISMKLSVTIMILYLSLAVYIIFLYAPVDSINKSLDKEERCIQEKKSRRVLVLEIILIFLIGYLWKKGWIAMVATLAVFSQSITLLPIWNQTK